jgi:hypothetical protein
MEAWVSREKRETLDLRDRLDPLVVVTDLLQALVNKDLKEFKAHLARRVNKG